MSLSQTPGKGMFMSDRLPMVNESSKMNTNCGGSTASPGVARDDRFLPNALEAQFSRCSQTSHSDKIVEKAASGDSTL